MGSGDGLEIRTLYTFDKDTSGKSNCNGMRRSRERRRAGSFCYLVELPGPLIDRLVNLGWLAGVARNDKAALLAAFQRFVQQALGFTSSGGSE